VPVARAPPRRWTPAAAVTMRERRDADLGRTHVQVAQAQGMVSAPARCTVSEPLVMMNERAQVQHQTLADIAEGVVERRIRFGL